MSCTVCNYLQIEVFKKNTAKRCRIADGTVALLTTCPHACANLTPAGPEMAHWTIGYLQTCSVGLWEVGHKNSLWRAPLPWTTGRFRGARFVPSPIANDPLLHPAGIVPLFSGHVV